MRSTLAYSSSRSTAKSTRYDKIRGLFVFFSSPGTSAASGRAATSDCADSGIPPMLGVWESPDSISSVAQIECST